MENRIDGVDFDDEIVVVFALAESITCDAGEITDIVFDDDFNLIHPLTTTTYEMSQNVDCGSDITTQTAQIALSRKSLPDEAFSVSMFAGDAPSETMSFVAAREFSINDDGIQAVGVDGVVPVGETRIAYDVYTHCGVEYLAFGRGSGLWKVESDIGGEVDFMPSDWADKVENQYVDLLVERPAKDRLEVVAVGADEVVAYAPTDDKYWCQ